MKCIQCGTDNKLKDRTANQGRCTNCQHSFVFEPTNPDDQKITDTMFVKILADISANDTLFFTSKQLFYFLNKRVTSKRLNATRFFRWLSSIFSRQKTNKFGDIQELLIKEDQFQTWLNRWQQINGSILKMLPAVREETAPAPISPDVTAYSFDRLVVCDNAAIAQMLIANNFHFENNCAILSITGYPQSIFNTTMQMLRRNPDLTVYALHDCNPRGMSLVFQLHVSPSWFHDSKVTIIDVGLLPRQIIAASRDMSLQNSPELAHAAKILAPQIRQDLSAPELEWLESGNFVELESFSPQKLIKILIHGIANSRTLDGNDSSLILIGDPGSSMYAYESFG